jgi:hypothetical protein
LCFTYSSGPISSALSDFPYTLWQLLLTAAVQAMFTVHSERSVHQPYIPDLSKYVIITGEDLYMGLWWSIMLTTNTSKFWPARGKSQRYFLRFIRYFKMADLLCVREVSFF